MKLLLKILIRFAIALAAIYVAVCCYLYFNQENILFHPTKLAKSHVFESEIPFDEINMTTKDNKQLNALHFKAKNSKGLVFYVHGNAGSIDGWKGIAKTYTDLNYDLFVFDFRGFGKSEGTIESEAQFFEDVRQFYRLMQKQYAEKDILIIGYSIGTGSAAMLASENDPKALILLAPYYNLEDMMKRQYSYAPTFILKYRFETDRYLPKIKVPVTIFHGKDDKAIYFGSSLKLKKLFKKKDRLFPLENQGHVGMDENVVYLNELRKMLE